MIIIVTGSAVVVAAQKKWNPLKSQELRPLCDNCFEGLRLISVYKPEKSRETTDTYDVKPTSDLLRTLRIPHFYTCIYFHLYSIYSCGVLP